MHLIYTDEVEAGVVKMKRDNTFFKILRGFGKRNLDEGQLKEKNGPQYVFNVSGGQVNIAHDNGTVNAAVSRDYRSDDTSNKPKFRNSKKQIYIKNWNSRLFLHLDNDERPLTLADAFIMPDGSYRIKLGRIKYSDYDTLGDLINKFIKYERASDMLITGVPGIGKSTITSWIANQYKDDEGCIILRFRDWESEELEDGLLKAICKTLECRKKDLENKVLILDGFDEMKTLDIREKLLNTFLNDIKDFEVFKCIITSRPAYIDASVFRNRMDIVPFDKDRIERFYQKITGVKLNGEIIDDKNLEVLGVPVILYMAIMSNIDITESTSKPELYNRIFAEEGGIFDRFCEYDNGSQVLRNPENIKKHLRFLKEIAFKMFEKNDLQIQKNECKIPELEYQGKPVSILEFPIKHLFENTNPNIEFIHGSIYEYFVSEYIAMSMLANIGAGAKGLAGGLGKMLKRNKLSAEILEFLKFKVGSGKLKHMFAPVNDAFQLMLQDGMTYYTGERYKNANICEMNVFINMLEIVHLWDFSLLKVNRNIYDYLKYNVSNLNLGHLDLREVKLSGIHLYRANLCGSDLSRKIFLRSDSFDDDILGSYIFKGAFFHDTISKIDNLDLKEADLKGSNLKNIIFENVDLRGADLRGADLSGSDIRGADLSDALLENLILIDVMISENQIDYLKKNDLRNTKVYMNESGKFVSYEEYCRRRRLEYYIDNL